MSASSSSCPRACSVRPPRGSTSSTSIVGWKEGTAHTTSTPCATATATGTEYQRLSQLTGGVVESVCKPDYSRVFDEVTKGIAGRLGCEFGVPQPSSGTVDPHTVVVRYASGASTPNALIQVTDAAKCSQNPNAWYYESAAHHPLQVDLRNRRERPARQD